MAAIYRGRKQMANGKQHNAGLSHMFSSESAKKHIISMLYDLVNNIHNITKHQNGDLGSLSVDDI